MEKYLRDMSVKPWFDEYKLCKMPNTLMPYPDIPVFDFLDEAAKNHPYSGVVQSGLELKYPKLRDKAYSLATALSKMGVQKGDRIATILPTSIQYIISDYAVSRLGAVHIPSSFLEPEEVLVHKFKDGAPKALICNIDDEGSVEMVKSLAKKTDLEFIIITKVDDYSKTPPEHEDFENMIWLTDLINEHDPNPPDVELDVNKDLETLLFTGGTTGLPKGCMLTHKNISSNAMQSKATFGPIVELLGGKFSVLIGIPFYHSYGHSIMHTMTHVGATQLLVTDPRDTKSMISMIKEHFPILQFGVPTQYMKMLKEEVSDISILGVSGSAALPPEVQDQFEKKSGGGVLEGYGLSECSPNTHLNPSLTIRMTGGRNKGALLEKIDEKGYPLLVKGMNKATSYLEAKTIGKGFSKILPLMMNMAKKPEQLKESKKGSIGVPFLDTEIKVINEAGEELTCAELMDGKVGEMLITGPQRMLGYWPEPGSGLDDEGYVHTGDVVKMDQNGYFYVVDRTKDMIIVSGFKVYSREIDDILYQHPGVDLAATVGIEDPDRPGSERVKVFVQPKPGYEDKLTPDDIKEFLKDKVAKYARPKEVEIIKEMPLTGVGKVDKKSLRKN